MSDKEKFGAETSLMKKIIFIIEVVNVRLRFILILVLSGLVIGYWDTIMNYYEKYTRPESAADAVLISDIEYFCPMHPNVIRDAPGSCPICGMPLSMRHKGGSNDELPPDILGRVQLSPYRVALAGVKTTTIDYFPLEKFIEVPGTVEFDERKLARISARTGGRIDNLFVNYTGTTVKQGDSLAKIYSPQLMSTIDELLNVSKAGKNVIQAIPGLDGTQKINQSFAESARKRLRYLGITDEQIARIERTGKTDSDILITSPIAGIVTKKYVVEGQYVDEGTPLFDVANLLVVWMQAKVYEEDIQYVKIGQHVSIRAQAYPNAFFDGTVAFIDYVMDKNTRTINVRVDIGNSDLKLKPGMFLTAAIKVPISEIEPFKSVSSGGRPAGVKEIIYYCPMHPEVRSDKPGAVCAKCGGMKLVLMPPETGKKTIYTCVMHPEIRQENPGDCQKCGMKLIPEKPSEEKKVVYVCPMHSEVMAAGPGKCEKCKAFMDMDLEPRLVAATTGEVLVVPETAVIDTGMKKVVYIEHEAGIFDAIEVALGARSGGYYPVISGLKKGDKVVAAGTFLVDAESRLNPIKKNAASEVISKPAEIQAPSQTHKH
ncbi:MAG: efflux RND transporter periplasmic adaptor subunit [Candidatus Wallbacteria bacterium]